jgi:ParB-like chromosome segregation protein Spo0J
MVEHDSITVSKELNEFIMPLSKQELGVLEQSILKDGCRDPLVVWPKDGGIILVDGHNRYRICQKHGVSFKIRKIHFFDLEEVKVWMVDNQLGRRNLNPDQLSYYRGVKYLTLKKSKGGYTNVLSKGQNELSTTQVLARHFNVSESTIKRDAKFAAGLNAIGRSNPKLKARILSGESNVKKSDIQVLAEYKVSSKLKIVNEADIHNKAKKIRDEILNDVEKRVADIQDARIRKAKLTLEESEPIFLKRDDRLRKIKGMILSAINTAIQEENVDSIKELKRLIGRLEHELFHSE